MMKYFEIFVLFALFSITMVVTNAEDDDENEIGMTLDELADALESFAEDCEPKPERDHIKQLLTNDENPHENSKCFRRCLMEQFELIDEGQSQMNKDKVVDMMGMMYADNKEAMEEIVDHCNTKNGATTEKCENAHQHGMCILSQLKEKGFKVPEVKE
ncbi:general odorant-binding protein 19d [Glossina fuscipes]|uniref:General odorant-binding protein 19d n=1 Tax=Glossina fuscipes TaxID=7396 RepID=A0A9C5Z3A5_9MUSC|nr:general odorant-binding protein 19d [Glossina fuscipes]KAI9582172.1 hypothetical protein GQX74_015295 [Glossina fuscipes]